MTKRDTFARVELDSAGSLVVRCGEVDHVFWDSDKGYLQRAAELINAAHDKAVREAVAERDDRIAELERVLKMVSDKSRNPYRDRHHECDSRVALQSIHDIVQSVLGRGER